MMQRKSVKLLIGTATLALVIASVVLLQPRQTPWVGPAAMAPVGANAASGQQAAVVPPEQADYGPLVMVPDKVDLSPALISIPPIVPEPVAQAPENEFALRQGGSVDPAEVAAILQDWHGWVDMPAPIQNLDGINNRNSVMPPDTEGDVGANHYVQWVNLSFQIWDKSGSSLYGPANGNTLWSGFGGPCETSNSGDPIALYDPMADRWFMSQFALPDYPYAPFYQCIAVSQSPDPLGFWYRYQYTWPNSYMNDYPKFGVWPDGYYLTVNQFASGTGQWRGAGVAAFERSQMLLGLTAQMVYFNLYTVNSNYGGMLPSDLDGATLPPSGAPNYFAEWDDSSWIAPHDAVRIWEFHVDWTTPGNSTFGNSGNPNWIINTSNVDPNMCNYSRNCIPQPGTSRGLDAISDRLMYRLQYRNLGSYESLVTNHTVDATGSDRAGIHWFELRKAGSDWTMEQEGVYSPDTTHRWMGSIAQDQDGNMALGYSVSDGSTYPGIRYAGRLAGDTPGDLPQAEVLLWAGSGYQSSTASRWGDYSMMAVDPADDCTFWYTQEYIQTSGSSNWRTRIGSFKFPSCGDGATPTPTPTNTPTATPTNTPTATPTNTPTATPTDTPTATPTNTPTATPTDTPTATPTDTPTATPTDTPVPPTVTAAPQDWAIYLPRVHKLGALLRFGQGLAHHLLGASGR